MTLSSRLEHACKQIEFAREYTRSLLVDIKPSDWFLQPGGATTHLAWQTGHLAMAEYGLCLFRQRGRRSEDSELMSSKFRKKFSRGSSPEATADAYPSSTEILEVFDNIHAQVLREIPEFSEEHLDEPIDEPYAVSPTRLGALYFCSHHEMLHAGQIGLLRRLLGLEPVR